MVSNLYSHRAAGGARRRLASLMPVPDARVFFCNSGAEANEAAIKLARKHGLATGSRRSSRSRGRSTDARPRRSPRPASRRKRAAFEPLVDWFRFVPPGDLDALDAAMTADVGARAARAGDGRRWRAPARRRVPAWRRDRLTTSATSCSSSTRCSPAWAAAATGSRSSTPGRGRRAHAREGARRRPADRRDARPQPRPFEPGDHASTFGGGPVVCAGALAVLDTIEREGLLGRARAIGDGFRRRSSRPRRPARSSRHEGAAACGASSSPAGRERRRAGDDRRGRAREPAGARRRAHVAAARRSTDDDVAAEGSPPRSDAAGATRRSRPGEPRGRGGPR